MTYVKCDRTESIITPISFNVARPALKVQTMKCWPVRAQLHAVIRT